MKLQEGERKTVYDRMIQEITKLIQLNHTLKNPSLITISGFFPIKEEVDCLLILSALSKLGFNTALPVTLEKPPSDKPLEFRLFNPEVSSMAKDAFDIPCPDLNNPIVDPDVIITPLLGFDSLKRRIGYGGGYYDRTFRSLEIR